MSALSRRRPLTVGAALLGMFVTAAAVALAGYLTAVAFPPAHEFVAFVRAGSIDRDPIVEKAEQLDAANGLGAASEIAQQIGSSPWLVWRRYSVTAEGPVFVVRVQDADPERGERLVHAARDTLAAGLRRRYEAAMVPQRAYIAALEADVARLGEETVKLGAAANDGAQRTAIDRRVALAEVREKLRDAQLFAALSEPPGVVDDVRHRPPDSAAYRRRLTLTGAVLGLIAAVAALLVLAFRARSFRPFAGA